MTAKPLRIRLADVIDAIGSPTEGVTRLLDTQTGEIIPYFDPMLGMGEDQELEDAWERDPDRFRRVPESEARRMYRQMEWFAAGVDEEDLRERLQDALEGRGAFGRFRNVISRYPDLRDAWFRARDAYLTEQAEEWLADEEIAYTWVHPQAPPEPEPAPKPKKAGFDVDLYTLIALGNPIEREGGGVIRAVTTPAAGEARGLFKRLARALYENAGIAWRKRFVAGVSEVDVEGVKLRCVGARVEVELPVSEETRQLFHE